MISTNADKTLGLTRKVKAGMVAGKRFYIVYKMRLVVIAAIQRNLCEGFAAVILLNGIMQAHHAQVGFGTKARVLFKPPVKLPYR